MNHYSLKTAGAVIVLFVFTAIGWKAFDTGLYASTILAFIIDIAVVCHIYRQQVHLVRTIKHFISCIRYDDSLHFIRPTCRNPIIQELIVELGDTFEELKRRISEENTRLKYYEQLLNQVNLPVIVIDSLDNVEWRNRAAIAIFGNDIKLPPSWPAVPSTNSKVTYTTSSGRIIEMVMTTDSFTIEQRNLRVLSFKNISDMLEQKELEAQQKLIRVLAHEVMNSLSPILSLTETLTEYCDALPTGNNEVNTMNQALQTIRRRGEGLMQFVENYRQLMRLPAPVIAPVSVDDLIADMKQLFPAPYVSCQATPQGARVTADRTQLEQVLVNLLKNACEAVERQPHPHVRLTFQRVAGDGDHFYVEDNGPGLRPEVAEQAFVPFFTTKPGGSGIGLSLCRQIARLHGGNIHLQSKEGRGTRIDFMLPLPQNPLRQADSFRK